jgi:hypothetical protein
MDEVDDRKRGWCFVINNYTDEDEFGVYELQHNEQVRYVVCGNEVGELGTPHLQGYLYFVNKKSMAQVSSLLPRASLQRQRGTCEEASVYCKKDGDFFEHGVLPADQVDNGQRGGGAEILRWDTARQAAKEGRWDDIPSDIFLRHYSSLRRIRNDFRVVPPIHEGVLEHEWWYGEPGTGKTRTAFETYPDAYIKDPKERWWDSYDGQEVVIVDDFDKYQKALGGDMKRWLDRYPFQAPLKGSYATIRPRKIIITSNYHYDDIWDDDITRAAIARRVTLRHFAMLA